MNRPRHLGRRMFLYTTGGAALGIPFLSSLVPTGMRAQEMPAPRRFVSIVSYSGQIAQQWYPTATPAGYRLRDAVFPGGPKADGTTYLHGRLPGTPYGVAPLSDFAGTGGLSQILGADLDPYLAKMNLIRGMDFLPASGHSSGGAYLGNYAGGAANANVWSAVESVPTIDQVLAHSDRFYPTAPALRSLLVGTGSNNSYSYTDFGVPGGEVEQSYCILDPREAWNAVFGSFMSPDMPMENPNASLLNAIHEDYARLSRSTRLSSGDRELLERHMSFLADIERALTLRTGVTCEVPPPPRSIPNGYPWRDVSSIADLEDTVSLLVDVCVAALRCDLTRVVSFKVEKAITDASGAPQGSFHSSADVAGDWHQFAHGVGDDYAEQNVLSIHQWTSSRIFKRFVEQMDAATDVDGNTVLDNSLVVWGNELGYNHYNIDVQTVMAGGAGGSIETGRYLDYIDWDQDHTNLIENWGVLCQGMPHNRLLVSILQAMGLEPADYERATGMGYGHTGIIDAPWAWPGDYDMSAIGRPLPGLMTT